MEIEPNHLAGLIPITGQDLDFNMPWHDSMQPLNKNYLAIEHAVLECAMAGCNTIWIACNDDFQPLIKSRLGEYVLDPVWSNRTYSKFPEEHKKYIPIFYVPIHSKDLSKRDCLSWGVIYAAQIAYRVSMDLSKWIAPSKYYVSFPYGVYDFTFLRKHRDILQKENILLTYNDKSVINNEYLSFTFGVDEFLEFRRIIRKGTGIISPGKYEEKERLPLSERWSARHFTVEEVFKPLEQLGESEIGVEEYYNISSWDGYCGYIKSGLDLKRPEEKVFIGRKTNGRIST